MAAEESDESAAAFGDGKQNGDESTLLDEAPQGGTEGSAEDNYGAALRVGDRLIAKDARGFWCAAKVIAVATAQVLDDSGGDGPPRGEWGVVSM